MQTIKPSIPCWLEATAKMNATAGLVDIHYATLNTVKNGSTWLWVRPTLDTHNGIPPPESYAQQRAVPVILQVLWTDDLIITAWEGEERGIMSNDEKNISESGLTMNNHPIHEKPFVQVSTRATKLNSR